MDPRFGHCPPFGGGFGRGGCGRGGGFGREAVATPAETVLVPEAGATLMEAALAQGTAPEVEIDPEDAITTIRTIPDITTALDRSQGRSHSGTL
ncbi:unnamed protein product [Heligmosomoides polygyrus]|uniref:DUF2088 domain-containing protein n=1 Tax=Heligmosomoides polygyrus TaxID=6339 RepID=A0A183FUY0_HELPZ|nr:unnamed protein product [Heligmosomoides polygyrus]